MKNKIDSFFKNWGIILFFSFVKLTIHLLTYARYGIHRDEFMYFEMGNHLSWGFLETPPILAIIARSAQIIFGYTEFAIRFFPAVAGTAVVFLVGALVKKLGGKTFAQIVALMGVLFSPVYLRMDHYMLPDPFNHLLWTATAYFVVSYLKEKNILYIYLTGLCVGLGMLTKYTIFIWAFALLTGLLISKERIIFKTIHPYFAISIAALIFIPNFIWQWYYNFPVIHHVSTLGESQLVNVEPLNFLIDQLLYTGPVVLFWLFGLYFVFSKRGINYHPIGWAYIVTILLFTLLHAKSYYPAGAYPVLFVFGGICIESLFKKNWQRYFIPALPVLSMLPTLPFALPVLPLSEMYTYSQKSISLGFDALLRWEDGQIHHLPQDYADMLGWPELASLVLQAYNSLSPYEKEGTMIYADNYGQAGAVDFYNNTYKVPKAVCLKSNYLMWSPDSINPSALIYIENNREDIEKLFSNIELIGRIKTPFAREQETPVYLCRNPIASAQSIWKQDLKENRFYVETKND